MPAASTTALRQQPTNVAESMASIVTELGDMFFERREEIEVLAATMLAKQHAFILGPPGTGKSAMVEEICNRITGGEFWSILMDRALGKEDSFGAIDIGKYEKQGIWERDVEATLVTAHIAFIDEVGKAGPASLNPYLRAFNERKYRNGKTEINLPLISAIGASNEYLEPELAAMWDRFLVRLRVNYLQEPTSFAALLSTAVNRGVPASAPTTVGLADFQHAVDVLVPAIKLPPGVLDSMVGLRATLRAEQITPSDRRWKQSIRLLQAMAFMAGRDTVDDDDLQILQHVLWDVEAEVPIVQQKVLSLTSPITRGALEAQQMIDEINAKVDSMHGQAQDKRAEYGGEANHKIAEIVLKLDKLEETGKRQGRQTGRIDTVRASVRTLKAKVFVECLNVPADRATVMASK